MRLSLWASLLLSVWVISCSCDDDDSGDSDADAGADAAPLALTVTPEQVDLRRNQTQQFTASIPVTWSIQEAATGGSIDSAGLYTAPNTLGVYHVIATSQDDPALTASVEIEVALFLDVLAGGIGSAGYSNASGSLARFNTPEDVAVDSDGNLYITDLYNYVIRKLDVSTGAVSTLIGQAGEPGLVDGTAAVALLQTPWGLTFDENGNLYVTDYSSDVIRKVSVTNGVVEISTLVIASAGLTNPLGIVADGAGSMYVADWSNHVIRKVDLSDGSMEVFAGVVDAAGTSAEDRLNGPSDVAIVPGVALYVCEIDGNDIRKIDLTTGDISTVVSNLDRPLSLSVGENGKLYVTDESHVVYEVDPTLTPATLNAVAGKIGEAEFVNGLASDARFFTPSGIAIVDSLIYIADSDNHSIRQFDLGSNQVSTLAGNGFHAGSADGVGTEARFNGPFGVTQDETGNLYVADSGNHTIRKVDMSKEPPEVSTVAGIAGMSGYVEGNAATALFNGPYGVAHDGAGHLYVADTSNHKIRKIDLTVATTSSSYVSLTAGGAEGSGTSSFDHPNALVSDQANILYVADTDNSRIQKITLGATGNSVSTLVSSGFSRTRGVTWKSATELYFASDGNHEVFMQPLPSGALTSVVGMEGMAGNMDGMGSAATLSSPHGLAIDETKNVMYIGDVGTGLLRQVDLNTFTVTTLVGVADEKAVVPGKLPAVLNDPTSITVLPNGDIVIVSRAENSLLIVH